MDTGHVAFGSQYRLHDYIPLDTLFKLVDSIQCVVRR